MLFIVKCLIAAGVVLVVLLGPAKPASAAPAPCPTWIPPALKIVGLPARVVAGREDEFGVEDTFATSLRAGQVDLVMEGPRGLNHYETTLSEDERGNDLVTFWL